MPTADEVIGALASPPQSRQGGALQRAIDALGQDPYAIMQEGRTPQSAANVLSALGTIATNVPPISWANNVLGAFGRGLQATARGEQDPADALSIAGSVMGRGITSRPVGGFALGSGPMVPKVPRAYPLAPRDEWYGSANYESAGGNMVSMSPDEFLKRSRPLKIDDISRENIDDLKNHIQKGGVLDPLELYAGGEEDGRHRAVAAKELGIEKVPVINFRGKADTK